MNRQRPSPTILRWLLVIQILIIAPHALRLPAWVLSLAVVSLLWCGYAHGRRLRPPRFFLGGLAFAVVAGLFLQFGTLTGRDPGVSLLVLMMALKLHEVNSQRDIMVVVLMDYFLVITNFLYTQSLPLAFYMFAVVLLNTAFLAAVYHPGHQRLDAGKFRLAGSLLLQAAPITLLLFVLFPRLPGPLWGLPDSGSGTMTGMSDRMSPGAFDRLIRSEAVAFRAEFDGPAPPRHSLYWRGPVLWHYDGLTWSPGQGTSRQAPRWQQLRAPVDYSITLEPHRRDWLFALDVPGNTPDGTYLTSDSQLRFNQPLTERRHLRLRSYLDYRIGIRLTRQEWLQALQLPEGYNPRTIELARSWREELNADALALIDRAMGYFRNQPFRYTLTPPLLGDDAVDEFLFDTRAGFCEHYAGALTVLLRAAGVPARVVTGYQGGETNPLGGYLLVRQSDAHAWVEAWLPQRGWRRLDPTSMVAPERIEDGLQAALPMTEGVPILNRQTGSWSYRLFLAWDAMETGWTRWVLGYGRDAQRRFLRGLGLGVDSPLQLLRYLAIGFSVVVLAVGISILLHRPVLREDPARRIFRRFERRMEKAGLPSRPWEGPLDYAARIGAARPEQAAAVREICRLYARLRYGENPAAEDLRRLKARVAAFRPRP